jgi:mono/diheme cytochrome c family protein
MNAVRHWVVVGVLSAGLLGLGFGCASKPEKTPGQASAGPAPNAAAVPSVAATPAVYKPDTSHANEPMPDGVFAWDELLKSVDATNGQAFARFTFSFTNIARNIETGLETNVTSITNFTVVTNKSFWGHRIVHVPDISHTTNMVTVTNSITPLPVTILSVHPSCGCTTAELPPVPWTISPGTNAQIKVSVNLAGKNGMIFKTVNVSTDRGSKTLTLKINILPAPVPIMTDADRIRAQAIAKVDRQAVFKNDCAECHAKPGEGKYGKLLFDAVCGICHESQNRASMVPDIHALKVPTNQDFWRTWITHGKPGSLMPAFSTAEGGPLNDLQIASLAAYLDSAIPSKVAPPPQ